MKRAYLRAALAVGVATGAGVAIGDHVAIADEAMLYVIAILFAALGGRGPSIAASVASVAGFDFFFVAPRYTFTVSDLRSLITFAVLLVVGVASGGVIERLRETAVRAKAEELRNSLLSSVSHDLRTPLAAITGMATTLRERTADSVELDTIISEASRLSALLTNLLAITKVESGAAPRRDWVPIEEILGPVLARLDKELASHPVTTAIPADLIAHVDPILFEQLLLNLLDNAAKHTPAETPIEIIGRREGGAAVVEIVDRGPGLAPDQHGKLFDKFYRGRTSAPGAGLGLAVCRGIAAAHGGTVEVAARDGGGTRFEVRIPDGEPMPAVEDPEPSPATRS
ncbi:MAG: ATP-binding protein [Kofleriaceae bacterium]